MPALPAGSVAGHARWVGTSALVSRALRLIGEGALDDDTFEALAERLA